MRTFSQSRFLAPFRPGDPLFEQDRLGFHTPPMTVFGGDDITILSSAQKQQQALNDAVEEAFKRKDYKTLFQGLDFLKFSPATAESIVSLVSTAAGFVSTIGAVVAAFETTKKVMTLLGLDSGGFDMEQAIKDVGKQVDQIYGYLRNQARNGLFVQAGDLRNKVERVKNAVETATISPSPVALDDLTRLADELNETIDQMLVIERGNITFSYTSYAADSLWLKVNGSPYLERADGAPTTPLTELSSLVWDPGHYIDTLAAAIRLRILVATTLEPFYRSTGYRRSDVEGIVPKLRSFIDYWRASMMVANPGACLLADGTLPLYNHLLQSNIVAPGILVGAVCPVTGMSSLQVFDDFTQQYVSKSGGLAASGSLPIKFQATNSPDALSKAHVRHAVLTDKLIRACGLADMEKLLNRLREVARAPAPTESVRFASVRIHYPSAAALVTPTPAPATVDLGYLKRWAQDPNKTYPALRYFTGGGKVTTLRMARRGLLSHVRLGYKLRIDNEVFVLTTWHTQPAPEQALDWFPSATIEKELTLQTKVYDCVQSRQLSAAEEESFDESGDAGTAQRVLLNERSATVKVRVRMEFQALAGNQNNAYLGEVKLFVQAVDQLSQPNAFLLDIDVLETHLAEVQGVRTEEVTVEGLSLHVVPSFLVAGADFFDDYHDAFERMLQAKLAAALDYRHRLNLADVPLQVDNRPKFSTTQAASSIEVNTLLFAMVEREPDVAAEVSRYLLPQLNR